MFNKTKIYKKSKNLFNYNNIFYKNLDNKKKNINFPKPTSTEIYSFYKYCQKIEKSILMDLTAKLNFIHKVNHSHFFWRSILGHWLSSFVKFNFKIYNQLKYISKNYKINCVYIPKQNKRLFEFDDTKSFEDYWIRNNNFFFFTQFKIIKYFKFCKKISFIKFTKINYLKKKNNKSKKYLINLLFHISHFFNLLFKRNNYAFMTNTYLPFIIEKIFEIKLFQVPSFYNEQEIIYKKYNKKLRSILTLKKSQKYSKFENFLRSNIFNYLPKSFLENFKEINKISRKKFPGNPKFIFTSNSFAYDEVFKFFMASKKEDYNTPIYIGQHGGNYFSYIHTRFTNELKIADKFLSWGIKNEKKVSPMFNFKVFNKISRSNNADKLVIVFPKIYRNMSNLYNYEHEIKNEILETIEAIKYLNFKIKSQIVLRIDSSYFEKYFGTKYVDLFKGFSIKKIDSNTNFKKLLKNAKLTFFTADSTGVLESFAYNMPTILFSDSNRCINKNYIEKYNLLHRNEILFQDKFKAVEFINKKWNEIDNWWYSEQNQRTLKLFNKNYNIAPNKKSLDKLMNKLINNK